MSTSAEKENHNIKKIESFRSPERSQLITSNNDSGRI